MPELPDDEAGALGAGAGALGAEALVDDAPALLAVELDEAGEALAGAAAGARRRVGRE